MITISLVRWELSACLLEINFLHGIEVVTLLLVFGLLRTLADLIRRTVSVGIDMVVVMVMELMITLVQRKGR